MILSTKALALACATLWGGCLLLVGIVNAVFPSYGGEFLRLMNSVYPGYQPTPTPTGVIVGGIWGFLDGGVAGFLAAWLYNLFLRWGRQPNTAQERHEPIASRPSRVESVTL
jgi:hypothetical protein